MQIERWNPHQDGPFSEAALSAKLRAMGYAVHRYRYPPGTCFPVHTHDMDKIDAVLAGRFRLILAAQAFDLGPGEWIAVPRHVPHSAEVLGNEAVLSLDASR